MVVINQENESVNPTKRLIGAIKGQNIDRIPVVPKIWVDYAARVTNIDIKQVITDPLTALRVIALAGVKHSVDAVRQFHLIIGKSLFFHI